MNWREVSNQANLDELTDIFGEFHDACLKEMHLWTDTWVEPNLSMSVGTGWSYHARLLFQRQWKDPSAIEIIFDEIRSVHIALSPPNYDDIIFSATLLLKDGVFFWAEAGNWQPDDPNCNDITWIAASQMKWRDVSGWMGEDLRYGPHETPTSD